MYFESLPHSPESVATILPQYLAQLGMADDVKIAFSNSALIVTVSDGTVITVNKPVYFNAGWNATVIAPDHCPVIYGSLDFNHDFHMLAAWVAEIVFTTLDMLKLQAA